jgi:hypothetical protein
MTPGELTFSKSFRAFRLPVPSPTFPEHHRVASSISHRFGKDFYTKVDAFSMNPYAVFVSVFVIVTILAPQATILWTPLSVQMKTRGILQQPNIVCDIARCFLECVWEQHCLIAPAARGTPSNIDGTNPSVLCCSWTLQMFGTKPCVKTLCACALRTSDHSCGFLPSGSWPHDIRTWYSRTCFLSVPSGHISYII